MKKKLAISLIIALSLVAISCSMVNQRELDDSASKKNQNVENKVEKRESLDVKREIAGVNGETIVLPPARDIKRVVIMFHDAFPSVLNIVTDNSLIVGAHSHAFTSSNQEILEIIFPEWKDIETSFIVENAYNANIEELMKLNPDIIFYDSKWQREGMDKLEVPLIDTNMDRVNNDMEKITTIYEKVFKEVFDLDTKNIIQSRWDEANKMAKNLVDRNGKKKTALFVWGNMGEQVSVYGKNTFVEIYFDKLNLKNVAEGLDNYKQVSMEQVYQWDPEFIFITNGSSAKEVLNNHDESKDWSKLTAFKNRHIYDIPKTLGSWADPSTDSSLMVYCLLNKLYPEKLSDEKLSEIVNNHYKIVHNVELEPELIQNILEP